MLSVLLAAASASTWPPPSSRYDVIILGTGVKESLLAGLLAQHGKSVLQLDSELEGSGSATLDLQQLVRLAEGPNAKVPSESKVGKPSDYRIERAPKMFVASGEQLQVLVKSGVWQHMSPPGFKRVHRALMYRKRPDGKADVHRVLANSEDVRTSMHVHLMLLYWGQRTRRLCAYVTVCRVSRQAIFCRF